jgi:hypothetical protein
MPVVLKLLNKLSVMATSLLDENRIEGPRDAAPTFSMVTPDRVILLSLMIVKAPPIGAYELRIIDPVNLKSVFTPYAIPPDPVQTAESNVEFSSTNVDYELALINPPTPLDVVRKVLSLE